MTWCWNCDDEYEPVEYAPAPLDPDEPRFCSSECEERWTGTPEAREAAGYQAPLFGL